MKNKLIANTAMPFMLQIVTIISGFILPRMIIAAYGSRINGLIHSITQFLSIISFMEAGVGSVVRYNLYKPLADHDMKKISGIIASANKFYRTLAIILLGYTLLLTFIYPYAVHDQFGWFFTASLIVIIAINSFSQYYFGQVNQLLLTADQRGYIHYTIQICTIIVNTIVTVILIYLKIEIHYVRFSTALIYLFRPLFLKWYVSRHYKIDYSINYDDEPIKQKWNGLAQHISYVIIDQTDIIVLTIFSTLANVSIYSVYQMVVGGIKTLLTATTNGIEAYMGNVVAKNDKDRTEYVFSLTEWVIHNASLFVFGCTTILLLPFVKVYTNGISDINYYAPTFSILISVANACHCLRLPYSISIISAGHYKKTQWSYIVAALLNVSISIVLVVKFGLVGVAIGTLVSMSFHTIWMAIYSYKNIIYRRIIYLIKQLLFDFIIAMIIFSISGLFDINDTSYLSWMGLAIKYSILIIAILFVGNYVFYKDNMCFLLRRIKK